MVIASRPSDYVEMADVSRALASCGYEIWFVYLYSRDDPSSAGILARLESLSRETGVSGHAIEVTDVPARLPAPLSGSGTSTPAGAADHVPAGPHGQEQGLRSLVLWIRRHNLHFYPKNTIVGRTAYRLARLIDAVRDPNRRAHIKDLLARLQFRQLPVSVWWDGLRTAYHGASMVLHYRRFGAFISASIQALQLDAILIPEDIVGASWPVAVHGGHANGIPTLVLPYTLANQQEAVQSLKDAETYQARTNPAVALRYPRWRYQAGTTDIIRLPSEHIVAHEALGISPPDPWMMNSGFSDKVLVDSQASFEYFRAGGIPADQLAIVGSVSLDRMARLRTDRPRELERLRTKLQLAGSKPLLLISGCPDQLSAQVPFCEFATMGELARSVGEALAPLADSYHLVVRPHPNFEAFATMLAPFGIAAATAPTASLVPLADVFVAFASATIRWAAACGIPSVNYDVFHYGYNDFAAAKSVAAVNTSDQFRTLVRSLIPGSPVLEELRQHARRDSEHWGVMDGGSLGRIEREIHLARQRRQTMTKESVLHA